MDEELETGLWTSREEGVEFDTFTDEFGETISELKAPLPLKSLREHGVGEYNSRQLDRHTGGHSWARKGGDVASTELFDTDLIRPVTEFVKDGHRRSAVQINLNRNVTQHETLREDFEPRDTQLYDGYNPLPRRTMSHFVPTRRSVQELSVVGTERRLEPRVPIPSDHEEPTGAGSFHNRDGETRGLASWFTKRAGQETKLHMGEWSGLHSLSPNDRVSVHTSKGLICGDVALSRTDSVLSHVANRVTIHDRPWGQVEERPDVKLSTFDSQPGGSSRVTRSTEQHRALAADDTVLGRYDSTTSRDPQRSTFSDAARVAADLILGTQDSTKRPGTSVIGTGAVSVQAMKSDIVATKRLGTAHGRHGWYDYAGEHRRVLDSDRSRDSESDSQHVERVVADIMERRNNVVSEQSRRLRDDPVAAHVGRGRSHGDAPSVPFEEVYIGGSDATDMNNERRNRINRRVRNVDAVAAREWNVTSTIPVIPVSRDSVRVTLPPVESQPQRRWRDGGVISARQKPLSAGPMRSLVHGGASEKTPLRSSVGTTGRQNLAHVRSDTPSLYLSSDPLRV